jgi:hypothetical protein
MGIGSIVPESHCFDGRLHHPKGRRLDARLQPGYLGLVLVSVLACREHQTSMSGGFDKKGGAMKRVRATERTVGLLLIKTPPQYLEPAVDRGRVTLRNSAGDCIGSIALLFDIPLADMARIPLDIDGAVRSGWRRIGGQAIHAAIGRASHEIARFQLQIVCYRSKTTMKRYHQANANRANLPETPNAQSTRNEAVHLNREQTDARRFQSNQSAGFSRKAE